MQTLTSALQQGDNKQCAVEPYKSTDGRQLPADAASCYLFVSGKGGNHLGTLGWGGGGGRETVFGGEGRWHSLRYYEPVQAVACTDDKITCAPLAHTPAPPALESADGVVSIVRGLLRADMLRQSGGAWPSDWWMTDNLERPTEGETPGVNLREVQPIAALDGCIEASTAPAVKSQSLGAKLLVSRGTRFAVLLLCGCLGAPCVGAVCAVIECTLHRALRCGETVCSHRLTVTAFALLCSALRATSRTPAS